MKESVDNSAVLAFTRLSPAIQSLNRQLMFPDAVHAVASQNPLTAHLGNLSTYAALFDKDQGIFQRSVKNRTQERELLGAMLGEIEAMSKRPDEVGKAVRGILKSVNLSSIKTINDFADNIMMGVGHSFGSRNLILDEMLQDKQTKITKSTRDSHKIIHDKYGIPTLKDIAEGNNQPELASAELGDVIKLVKPSTDLVVYTSDPAMFEQYKKKPTDAMIDGGISIEMLPEGFGHESYPFVLKGENVALLDNFIDATQMYEQFKDLPKKKSFWEVGRMKKDAPAGEIEQGIKKEETGPQFQRMAPNGKPSKLTKKQYQQVRTPEFKKWFGDWENDPANASKVVDENGEPLVVYHGTKNKFDESEPSKMSWQTRLSQQGPGFYFTNNKKAASGYGKPLNTYVSIKNPLEIKESSQNITKEQALELFNNGDYDWFYTDYLPFITKQTGTREELLDKYISDNLGRGFDKFVLKNIKRAYTQEAGYTKLLNNMQDVLGVDGIIERPTKTDAVYVALSPNQIKSATENVGTFSTEDARIQFQKGPLILRHGGETKIKNFDVSKIKGGARGELGYGFYFSGDTKYKDYGKETTSIDASSLNIIDERSMPPTDLVERLLEWNKSLPESSFGLGKKEISKDYIGTIQKVIKDRPSYSISDVMKTVNERYPASREALWSEMMAGIGIDGMAATQGDGRGNVSIRQAVLYPQEKLNSLIIEEPQFQKATPTKETRKGLRLFEKEKVVTIGGKKIVRLYKEEIISPKAKAWFNNLFTSSGVLGEKIRTFKERMGGELNAEMDIARRLTNESMDLIKKYKGVVSSQDIDDYLTGNTQTNQLPVELSSKLNEMRVHIDRLTDRLISLELDLDKPF